MRAIPAAPLFVAAVAVATFAGAIGAAPAPTHPAAHLALSPLLELRERLESVNEASIDGRPSRALPAALRAESWWKAHPQELGAIAGGGELIARVVDEARGGHPIEAARAAWELSERSFPPGAASLDDALMRIDLVGMAAWLRAHGSDASWPDGTQSALDLIESRLTARHRATLASRFKLAADAAMTTPISASGDALPAKRLLDLVDVIEKVLGS